MHFFVFACAVLPEALSVCCACSPKLHCCTLYHCDSQYLGRERSVGEKITVRLLVFAPRSFLSPFRASFEFYFFCRIELNRIESN